MCLFGHRTAHARSWPWSHHTKYGGAHYVHPRPNMHTTTLTKESILDGEMMRATVLEVFAPDRVLLLFVSGSNVWRNECRLVNVDVPWSGREGVCKWLRGRVLDKKVWVECGKCDKYGRLFGVLYLDSDFATSVNAEAIKQYDARARRQL